MAAPGKAPEHVSRILCVLRLAIDRAVLKDDGVRTEHDAAGITLCDGHCLAARILDG